MSGFPTLQQKFARNCKFAILQSLSFLSCYKTFMKYFVHRFLGAPINFC